MKKSEIYKEVQKIVMNCNGWLEDDEKLEVLRELMAQEDLEKFAEEREAAVKA